jgi:hypothetical protein
LRRLACGAQRVVMGSSWRRNPQGGYHCKITFFEFSKKARLPPLGIARLRHSRGVRVGLAACYKPEPSSRPTAISGRRRNLLRAPYAFCLSQGAGRAWLERAGGSQPANGCLAHPIGARQIDLHSALGKPLDCLPPLVRGRPNLTPRAFARLRPHQCGLSDWTLSNISPPSRERHEWGVATDRV